MKNQELFDKTVSILVKAYQNDTLEYSDSCACAVGNMVAANNGISIIKKGRFFSNLNGDSGGWGFIIELGQGRLYDKFNQEHETVKKLLSTGYTLQNLATIERSFFVGTENEEGLLSNDEENFNGLMSVIDTLMQIHEATTEEAKQAKQLFVKIPA